ncbi:MAG: phosphatidylglycerophosphatase A [Elusimicrobiota bacterium]
MKLESLCEFFATDFYLGKLPYKFTGKYYGGGTIGTFVGLLLALLMPDNNWIYLAIVLILTAFSIFTAHKTSVLYSTGDDQRIIIDETVGYLIGLAFLPRTMNYLIISFIFFRFYDGLKPWPIKWLDKNLKGGLGITVDDLAAGIFANVTIRIFMH